MKAAVKPKTEEGKRPVAEFSLNLCQAAVFENENSNGNSFFKVVLGKSYKKDGSWHRTNNFDVEDLAFVQLVCQDALRWVAEENRRRAQAFVAAKAEAS